MVLLSCVSLLPAFQADVQGAPAEVLVGEAAVHVAGEAASRLLRGERVAVTVPLTTTSHAVRAHSASNAPLSAQSTTLTP